MNNGYYRYYLPKSSCQWHDGNSENIRKILLRLVTILIIFNYYKRFTVAKQPGHMMSNVGMEMSNTACFSRVFQNQINNLCLIYAIFDYCQT